MHIILCTQNVVVVDQPSGPQPATVTVRPIAREKEYLGLTVIMMVLCFLHGNFPTFFFLIPALIFAYVVSKLLYSFVV